MNKGDVVRFTGWDGSKRSEEELKICGHFKLNVGSINEIGNNASVVNWDNVSFDLDGNKVGGKFLLEVWNTEFEFVQPGENTDPKDQDSEESSQSQEKSPFDSVIDELESKYGKDLGLGPEPTDEEVTGPIIFTNHPERWPVRDIGDKKFKWNGEIWIEVDPEDLMPKPDGEKLRKERREGEQKWSDSMIEPIREVQEFKEQMENAPHIDAHNEPAPKVAETLNEIEKEAKLEYVRSKNYAFDKNANLFKGPNGIRTVEQVKEEYENFRIQQILFQRLVCLIEKSSLSGSEVNFGASLYRWYNEKKMFTEKQMASLAEIEFKHKDAIIRYQGPEFRPITNWRNYTMIKKEFLF